MYIHTFMRDGQFVVVLVCSSTPFNLRGHAPVLQPIKDSDILLSLVCVTNGCCGVAFQHKPEPD